MQGSRSGEVDVREFEEPRSPLPEGGRLRGREAFAYNCAVASILENLREKSRRLQREIRALVVAYRDPRTPWYARACAALVLAYAVSPIDLIPDFIPVLGHLDDLVLVPLGIALTVHLIPAQVMQDARAKSGQVDNPETDS